MSRYRRPESSPVRHTSNFHLASPLCMSSSEQHEDGRSQVPSLPCFLQDLLVQNYQRRAQHDSDRLRPRRTCCVTNWTDCVKLGTEIIGFDR